jgi:hypothetical protein
MKEKKITRPMEEVPVLHMYMYQHTQERVFSVFFGPAFVLFRSGTGSRLKSQCESES